MATPEAFTRRRNKRVPEGRERVVCGTAIPKWRSNLAARRIVVRMPVYVAITRRVRPGMEDEFQQGLRRFIQESFGHAGVMGASILTPPPGSDSREYGILRSFHNEQERDDFYASPAFLAWDKIAKTMTEGDPIYRKLHGLEAWFKSPHSPPPRWKMAVATLIGVYPTSLFLSFTVARFTSGWPILVSSLVFAASMVALLTWVVMPNVSRVLRPWLQPRPHPTAANAKGLSTIPDQVTKL